VTRGPVIYYVDPSAGVDTNNGTTAPWATLNHLLTTSSVVVPATVVTSTNLITFSHNVQINPTTDTTIYIPINTTMSVSANSDFTQMTDTASVPVANLPANYSSLASVQFGLSANPITLNQPITISLPVSSSYNGQTLPVYRSDDVGTTWTQITTCTVAGGICSFTTTSLSSFAVAFYSSPVSSNSGTSGGSGRIVLAKNLTGCDNRNTGFSITTGQSCAWNTNLTSTTSQSSNQTNTTYVFTKNLSMHSIDTDVLYLQKLLNAHGFVVAKTGPGSVGNETETFGNYTYKALVKFQIANKLKGDGVVGALTRVVLNR